MLNQVKRGFNAFFFTQIHIAPLVILRIAFGAIMLISTLRFILRGWVYTLYIKPVFHFTFYGFNWIKAPGATGIYLLFAIMIAAAAMVTIGLYYRVAVIAFFCTFTYVELIDKTTYLNHYYFISVMAFLMIWVPANRCFAVDTLRRPRIAVSYIPAWCINIFKLQLILVYFFAGVSKLTYDWLIAAVPLKIWLPALSHLPIIGGLLTQQWAAYLFSWFGMLFDLLVGFALLAKSTRKLTYLMVVIFHLATAWLFKIGMFPYIMIAVTIIFFSEGTHLRIIALLRKVLGRKPAAQPAPAYRLPHFKRKAICTVLAIFFVLQLLLPFRYLAYPGKLYWTEEGYRFSWRVMLMEKGGTTFFHIKNPATGGRTEIINAQYLTSFQETQMSTQPDMILQFAHYLAAEYQKKGIKNPVVTAESYVTLNGSGSRLFIDTTVNLAAEQEGFGHKKWILPFKTKN